MVWRFVQALGASPGLAVGSGVIGDIYKLEERGQALGIFYAVRIFSSLQCLFSQILRLSSWALPSHPWQGVSFFFVSEKEYERKFEQGWLITISPGGSCNFLWGLSDF